MANKKRLWPWAGLSFVALIALSQCFFHAGFIKDYSATTWFTQILSAKIEMVDQMEGLYGQAPDYLVMGDSFTSTGIDVAQLSGPHQYVNLGLVGSTSIAGSYFYLKRYLENNPKPKGIYFFFTQSAFNVSLDDVLKSQNLVRYFNHPNELLSLSAFVPTSQIYKGLLEYSVPAARWNLFFRNMLRKPPFGQEVAVGQYQLNQQRTQQMIAAKGFSPMDEKQSLDMNFNFGIEPSSFNAHYLDLLFRLTASYKIPIGVALYTMPEPIYDQMLAGSYHTVLKLYGQWQRDYPGVSVVDLPASLPASLYGQNRHFHSTGADVFSKILNQLLQRVPPPLFETKGYRVGVKSLGIQHEVVQVQKLSFKKMLWRLVRLKAGQKILLQAKHVDGGVKGGFHYLVYKDSNNDGLPDQLLRKSPFIIVAKKGAWSEWAYQSDDEDLFVGHSLPKNKKVYAHNPKVDGGNLYGLSSKAYVTFKKGRQFKDKDLITNLRIGLLDS